MHVVTALAVPVNRNTTEVVKCVLEQVLMILKHDQLGNCTMNSDRKAKGYIYEMYCKMQMMHWSIFNINVVSSH